MDCSLPCSSVHGIFQARILEWVTISFSRISYRPRDWTRASRIVGRRFTIWATRDRSILIWNMKLLTVHQQFYVTQTNMWSTYCFHLIIYLRLLSILENVLYLDLKWLYRHSKFNSFDENLWFFLLFIAVFLCMHTYMSITILIVKIAVSKWCTF